MRNVMLKAIPKSQFLRLVIEATNEFKKVYVNGIDVKGTVAVDSLAGVKEAIASAGIKKDLRKAMMNILELMVDESVTEVKSRKPNAEEIAKQFLTFVPYACVVPLRNRNHHKYTIGEPVIMVHGAEGANAEMFGMDKKGCIISKSATAADGLSHLPRLRKSLRPATNSEINYIVDYLYS